MPEPIALNLVTQNESVSSQLAISEFCHRNYVVFVEPVFCTLTIPLAPITKLEARKQIQLRSNRPERSWTIVQRLILFSPCRATIKNLTFMLSINFKFNLIPNFPIGINSTPLCICIKTSPRAIQKKHWIFTWLFQEWSNFDIPLQPCKIELKLFSNRKHTVAIYLRSSSTPSRIRSTEAFKLKLPKLGYVILITDLSIQGFIR